MNPAPGTFPGSYLGRKLQRVAQTIQGRTALDVTRQTFFINWGGWDHHDEVINNLDRPFITLLGPTLRSGRDLVEIGS